MTATRSLSIMGESLPLKTPFRISRGVKNTIDTIVANISESGVTGRGEGIPYPRYGQTVESALIEANSVSHKITEHYGREALLTLLPPGPARNALDCALWDIEARISGQSVASMMGIAKLEPLATAVTISLDEPEVMAKAAAKLAYCPVIKVKVDEHNPEDCIKAVRDQAPKARLIVDPNESWSFDLLDKMQNFLADARVALLEQPLAAGADEALKGFSPAVPICADEVFHSADDLDHIADRYQVINIKLDKTGGLTAAIDIMKQARSLNLSIMVGCMVCSSLSLAPAFHLAAQADFVDLDGADWLVHDRNDGMSLDNGILHPPSATFWGGP
ncbi:L-alanine-DL-glutamate epimerase-like enolase superfamily enzyme [Zymomonas mobilis]|uniref:N-acetyl-D-Glu racemase DgcA n=1 Tax=Zymomonas mobilis TaxID=542 RepID=UPI000B395BB7|nr:N-acetyl-D-Glu racemase DgcA [Zymomonas mobilis]ART92629.1 dipeptide epimerase [Zymomonas mobilis subsp. mobilis]MCP9307817.1 dipeptide epimerase [Zymomonas mobilis]TWD59276.1 L-alanine-DL-glutamate epimerase-like enolase superfamily enzyme [Zymomonas mobilis]